MYAITDAGRAEVAAWLIAPVIRDGRDELATKLALAITLPGVDAAALISAQRAVTAAELARLTPPVASTPVGSTAASFFVDARARAAQAELAWLDHCEASLSQAHPYPVETEVPRRGRPAKAAAGQPARESG